VWPRWTSQRRQYGGGFMVFTPSHGRVFQTVTDENVKLLGRADEAIE
jgi:hypothetical protein